MRSIRRRLFVSHLFVMLVAGIVFIAVAGALFGLLTLAGEGWGDDDRRKDGDREALGPLALAVPLGSAAAASALVSWRVSKRLATPIEEMRVATTRIADGDYDVVVDGGDTTELVQLAGDVNTMARQIGTTEARRLQLIGDIGHELRNPLATIEGSMEALMDGVIPADDETFAGIAREAARLKRLAGDLSALSAAGERAPGSERVDLLDVVTAVVDRLRPQATVKQLALTLDADGPANVVGSADQLTQVITNVVGNAVQYTDAGSVAVSVRVGSHQVEVSVADTGRGLAPEDLDRVFERFVRVDDDFADGTGVGLTIARSICQAHGGTLTASSDGPGRGATFVIELPLAR